MAALGTMLLVAGFIIYFIGYIRLIILAYETSAFSAIAVAFFGPAALTFIIENWYTARSPFLYELGGIVLGVFGALMTDLL
jgi:intracellular septation protein A